MWLCIPRVKAGVPEKTFLTYLTYSGAWWRRSSLPITTVERLRQCPISVRVAMPLAVASIAISARTLTSHRRLLEPASVSNINMNLPSDVRMMSPCHVST